MIMWSFSGFLIVFLFPPLRKSHSSPTACQLFGQGRCVWF